MWVERVIVTATHNVHDIVFHWGDVILLYAGHHVLFILSWVAKVEQEQERKKEDFHLKGGSLKCHSVMVYVAVEYGLMFAPDAKRRRLQGKDRQPCQLLGVIKLKCSSILAQSRALAMMDAFPALYLDM